MAANKSPFSCKEEDWAKWKEDFEDYVEIVNPGGRELLRMVAKAKEEVKESVLKVQWYTEEDWKRREAVFTLLKNKTTGEARGLIMGVPPNNGFEAWRSLALRYEPQVGIRRMQELAELQQLANKC